MAVKRKNYSFYMPEDFSEKLEAVQESNDKLKALSKSQALYYIISELSGSAISVDDDQLVEN